jgi:LysM repeat protein
MKKGLIAISILLSSISLLSAKATDKSCTDIPAGIFSCNPYQFDFIRVKEVKYQDQTKLVIDKLQPVPPKSAKKTTITDIIEKYVKINEPVRYQGVEQNITNLTQEALHHYISLAKQLKYQRESLISKIIQEEEARFEKQQLILKEHKYQQALQIIKAKQKSQYGQYKVKRGDTLSHIAYMFGLSTKELAKLNNIDKKKPIKINQKITLPYTQDKIQAIASATHKVKKGENLHTIAKAYDLKVSDIIKFNKFKKDHKMKVGEGVKLPLPYKLAQLKKKAKEEARQKRLAKERLRKYKHFGKHRLRVTATAYSSHRGQTDKTPFLAAWNNHIRPGMKIIAVSRDLLYKYGMKNGTKVKIAGLRGYYTVRDKMNKRYKKRIDIYMGVNRRRALRWGRRRVVIYW